MVDVNGKKSIGCQWVYAIKVWANGQTGSFKARLVAKGYSQIYGLDYGDVFFLVAKIMFVQLFIVIAATHHWSLYKLNIV